MEQEHSGGVGGREPEVGPEPSDPDRGGGPEMHRERETEPGSGPGAGSGAGDGEREERGWSRGGAFSDLQDAVSEIVDGAVRSLAPLSAGRFPRYDLVQMPGEGYRVLFDLPGVDRSDLDVTTMGDELTVSGVRHRPRWPEGADVLRTERSYGRFRRSLRVPADVDPRSVRAKLEDGVLVVTLPLRGEAARQRVEVES